MTRHHRKRGRPSKFQRASRVVALTLPDDVIAELQRINPDVAWAIVTLVEKRRPRKTGQPPRQDVELVGIPDRQFLIVVNRAVLKRLPGVSVIPLAGDRAFLALDSGKGMSDLEITVSDRLEARIRDPRERHALTKLRDCLRLWRRDRGLRFGHRAIIVAKRAGRRRKSA